MTRLENVTLKCAMKMQGDDCPACGATCSYIGIGEPGTLGTGMSGKEIVAGFPGDLFLTLTGITYLFAIAQTNGTIDWLVRMAIRVMRGRVSAHTGSVLTNF